MKLAWKMKAKSGTPPNPEGILMKNGSRWNCPAASEIAGKYDFCYMKATTDIKLL